MKKLVWFFVVSFLSVFGQSQNFQCINNNSISYFEDENSIKVIQIDSVIAEGDDLVYYNYPTLGEADEIYCYDPLGPSWIGRKMVAKPDGDNVFYNKDDQPITIKTLKEVGDYWICYEFFTGFYIEATIIEVESTEFLGITDMVKKITFQAMYSNGTPVAHPVNDMYLLLSENHGLIRTINFNVFPELYDGVWEEECHEYVLCGLSSPSTGKQNLTMGQIFNLNIGDEYHTKKFLNNWVSGDYNEELMIYTIIDKYVSPGNDTLQYQAERCGKKGVLVGIEIKYYYYNDTIGFTYYPQWYNYLDTIAEKLIVYGSGDYREYVYNTQWKLENSERMGKRYWWGLYSTEPHDCIEMMITDEKEVGYGDTYFIEGLGGPYWDYEYFWQDYHHLTYYKIGNEEWGNPWNCDSLLTGVKNVEYSETLVEVYPNPMTERATFSFENPELKNFSLFLYNMFGQKVREQATSGTEIVLERGELSKGIYIYKFHSGNKFVESGKLVIK